MGKKHIDWAAIQAEYIGGASIRDLAQKYKVSKSTIGAQCKAGRWTESRRKAVDRSRTKAVQKVAEAAADNATIAAGIKRKGLLLIDRLFDVYMEETGTEHRETHGNKTDIRRLRDLTAAYKDLTGDMPKVDAERQNDALRAILRRWDDAAGN